MDGQYMWAMYAMDQAHRNRMAILPDGRLCEVLLMKPVDRWSTRFHCSLWSIFDNQFITREFDQYDEILVIEDELNG